MTWLVALAEHGHMTDTAAILEVSQPTLSRAIGRVETELGTQLFQRRPDGVRLTPDGELVVATARQIQGTFEELLAELAARHDPDSGVVRLAFLNSMATTLVPGLLRDFHAEAPGVRVLLRQAEGPAIIRELESGAVDLGMVSYRPTAAFDWLPLQEERLVVIVAPTHRLAGRRRIRLEELAGDPLITTPPDFPYRALCTRLLAEAGLTPPVAFETADLATMEGLTTAGLGFAIVPEQYVGLTGSIGLHLPGRSATRTIGLAWPTDRPLSPPAARLLAFIRATLAA